MNRKYNFIEVTSCDMCGDKNDHHKILGQRLDKPQRLKPKKIAGISVSVQKCSNCNLIYSNPKPIPNSIQDHYGNPPENYWKPEYFIWDKNYFSKQINVAKELLHFHKGMTALDIGAGLGKAMLSLNHAGFNAYGIEPSKSFYSKAISSMNIDPEHLQLVSVESVDFEDNYFDFITFGAVFEHLYEPSKCLNKALRWLKPNGIIHIEVPSSKWLISAVVNFYYKMIGTNYVTNLSPMHKPFHLYEFDLKSFKSLSAKFEYSIERHFYDIGSIYHLPKIFHSILRSYMRKTDKGMQLTVYLKKKST